MVDREDHIASILETVRRSSQDNLLRLHDDLKERYTTEDWDRICSGEDWLDIEGVTVSALASTLAPLGVAGMMLMPVLAPMANALITLAFMFGYEKAKAEALGRELGLEGET